MDIRKVGRPLSRREFGMMSAAALATPLVGCGSPQSPANSTAAAPQVIRRPPGGPQQPLNIVFVFGDQERYFPKWPAGLSLPGHEALTALRMRAHARAGDHTGVRHEWNSYERVVNTDQWSDGEPSPELVELRQELLNPSL